MCLPLLLSRAARAEFAGFPDAGWPRDCGLAAGSKRQSTAALKQSEARARQLLLGMERALRDEIGEEALASRLLMPAATGEDTDSDSGVSLSSCPKALQVDVANRTLTQADYCDFIEEALLALGAAAGAATQAKSGTSRLNILLYILQRYRPCEDVAAINAKVKSGLAYLSHTGVVESVTNEKFPSAAKESSPTKEEPSSSKTEDEDEKVHPLRRPKHLSPSLSPLCGGAKLLSRQEVVKRVWAYVKKKNLQDLKQRTVIKCDDKLKAVTKKKKILQTELLGHLAKHMADAPY